jgi:hypothetical protein
MNILKTFYECVYQYRYPKISNKIFRNALFIKNKIKILHGEIESHISFSSIEF